MAIVLVKPVVWSWWDERSSSITCWSLNWTGPGCLLAEKNSVKLFNAAFNSASCNSLLCPGDKVAREIPCEITYRFVHKFGHQWCGQHSFLWFPNFLSLWKLLSWVSIVYVLINTFLKTTNVHLPSINLVFNNNN